MKQQDDCNGREIVPAAGDTPTADESREKDRSDGQMEKEVMPQAAIDGDGCYDRAIKDRPEDFCAALAIFFPVKAQADQGQDDEDAFGDEEDAEGGFAGD